MRLNLFCSAFHPWLLSSHRFSSYPLVFWGKFLSLVRLNFHWHWTAPQFLYETSERVTSHSSESVKIYVFLCLYEHDLHPRRRGRWTVKWRQAVQHHWSYLEKNKKNQLNYRSKRKSYFVNKPADCVSEEPAFIKSIGTWNLLPSCRSEYFLAKVDGWQLLANEIASSGLYLWLNFEWKGPRKKNE